MARAKAPARRRARRSRLVRKNPAYGFLPLIPVLGIVGAGTVGYGLYKAYDLYAKITRPPVLVGAAAGTIAGYKFGSGVLERVSYGLLGTGLGLLVADYLYPED